MKVASYTDIEILPDSVIYCDIPYKGTNNYRNMEFDHEAFYEWALRQTQPVFISEYSMPDDFVCIAEYPRTSSFSSTNNGKKEIERIYIPRTQKDMIDRMMRDRENQASLFD